jgi:hypothetical protein
MSRIDASFRNIFHETSVNAFSFLFLGPFEGAAAIDEFLAELQSTTFLH